MPEELPLDAVGIPFTPLVHHPAPAVTTLRRAAGLSGRNDADLAGLPDVQVELTPFSDTDRAIATSIVVPLMTPVI